jgi:hypothetical protein
MNDFIKAIEKYAWLLIITELLHTLFYHFSPFIYNKFDQIEYIYTIPFWITSLTKIATAVLLFLDFKKYHLKNIALACIAPLFFPLLGIMLFAFFFLLKKNDEDKSQTEQNREDIKKKSNKEIYT